MNLDSGSLAIGLFIGLIAGLVVAYIIASMLSSPKQVRILKDQSGKIAGFEYV